jgi:LEA14-like dessication related protein
MPKLKAGFVPAALLIALLLPAAGRAAVQKYDVEISVRERIARDVSLESATLVFILDLKSVSAGTEALARYDYRVVIGQTEYIKTEIGLDVPISIPAKGETSIAFPVKFTYAYLYANVAEARDRDRIECNLVGGLTFLDEKRREKRVPIAFSGDFPIFRGFDVKGLPFEARDLTMGGADLTFRAALINPNGFPLNAERVAYKVSVADKIIAEGTIRNAGVIEARGEKGVSLPLLLDFWEIGKDVAVAFDNPPVAVRFQGEVEAVWDWGRIVLPFDRIEKVPVKKAQNQ